MFALMVNLAVLNIAAVQDIQEDTQEIADVLIPRLIETTAIKDNLNLAILAAYDYVRTGDDAAKLVVNDRLNDAFSAQVDLFFLSRSETDFDFTTSFQDHVNGINDAVNTLISEYESGVSQDRIGELRDDLAGRRDEFATFLNEEIEVKIQDQSNAEREATAAQVQQTYINVGIVIAIAAIVFLIMFYLVRASITKPIKELTVVADSIANGKFQAVDLDRKDELGLFSDTFNRMTTQIKATQDALRVELEKTKQLDRQKTEFLSIAAHQLRTPMSGIKWLLSMAVDGDFGKMSGEASTQLKQGLQNADRMIALINNLLDVTRIETKEFQYEFVPSALATILADIHENLTISAQSKALDIRMDVPTDLPEVVVDADKIAVALQNLIDNAIKYTPESGTITVAAAAHHEEVVITVADTGYGIPEAEQDRIFTKFYRGSNIQTVQADGSGLGLFMVHEIINQHGGDISFTSNEGKGTTFTISLPLSGPSSYRPAERSDAGIDPELMTANVKEAIDESAGVSDEPAAKSSDQTPEA